MVQNILTALRMSNIYIPSYNRPNKVRTFDLLGVGRIVVPQSQAAEYRKNYGDAVMSIPDNKDGSVNKKRNAIIDLIKLQQEDQSAWVLDDDLKGIKRKKEGNMLSADEIIELFEKTEIMAKDMGAKFAGFDYSEDCMKLKDMTPFSLTKPCFHSVYLNVSDGIRYDERLRVQGDLEYWIAKMNVNRFGLKLNQYAALSFGEDGDASSVIGYNKNDRLKGAIAINNKYGRKIITHNKKGNQKFTIPIKGA